MRLSTLAERVHYARHCLPRGADDQPPSYAGIEKAAGLSGGTISRLMAGKRSKHHPETVPKLAKGLRVSGAWLEYGEGNAPIPTGPIPGATLMLHGDLPGWHEAVIEALNGVQIIPPEAFRAGAKLPVYRPIRRMTPRLAVAVSYYAWMTASTAEQTRYSSAEGRAASAGTPTSAHVSARLTG